MLLGMNFSSFPFIKFGSHGFICNFAFFMQFSMGNKKSGNPLQKNVDPCQKSLSQSTTLSQSDKRHRKNQKSAKVNHPLSEKKLCTGYERLKFYMLTIRKVMKFDFYRGETWKFHFALVLNFKSLTVAWTLEIWNCHFLNENLKMQYLKA